MLAAGMEVDRRGKEEAGSQEFCGYPGKRRQWLGLGWDSGDAEKWIALRDF